MAIHRNAFRYPLLSGLVAGIALVLASATYAQSSDPVLGLTDPDSNGHRLYVVNLRAEVVEHVDPSNEPPARAPMDPRNAANFRAWHKPKVRKLVREMEGAYQVEATTMTSYVRPSFSAYMPESTVEALQADDRVENVFPSLSGLDFSQTPPWANTPSGGETIPYGKIAIGTNDAASTTNIVYMIDGGMPPAHTDLTNVVATPVNPGWNNLHPQHASHIAGILSAATNNVLVRGVNPGAQVINVNRGVSDPEVRQALDWVLADSESRGIFAVANISSNSARWAAGHTSELANFMKRLSNRLLVVQSAGNQNQNACNVAYGPANSQDGILVVSAVTNTGQQAVPIDQAPARAQGFAYADEPGANWGPCVEMWAPGQHILSTDNTNANALLTLSGTSMAAPHVAALAARFGNTGTPPVERENEVRSRLRTTGFTDNQGATILVPSFVQPISYVVARLLSISSAYASASYPGFPALHAVDRNYWSTSWNAGNAGAAWIELDLGGVKNIDSLRLTPSQSPNGNVTHYIYAGNSPTPTTLIAIVSGLGRDLEPFVANMGLYPARYVRVYTPSGHPSWVAWRELEVYGY